MSKFFDDVLIPCVVISILIVWFSGPFIFPELYVEPEYPDIGGLEGFTYIPLITILVGVLSVGLAGFLTLGRYFYLRTSSECQQSEVNKP